jgi:hypothetical protein
MALTPVDSTLYSVSNARRPCYLRKLVIASGADPGASAMFPKDGQYIDTPAQVAPKWTTDTKLGQTV